MYPSVGDGIESFLFEFFNCFFVVSQIQFSAHQDDGGVGTVVTDLRGPLERGGEGV